MNYPYPVPAPRSSSPNSFVADNTSVLGYIDQPVNGRTLVNVDYSAYIPAITLKGYSFRIRPGGEPQLLVQDVVINGTNNGLSFYVKGGIGGQQYTVQVVTSLEGGEIRTDVLNVSVQGDGCGCAMTVYQPTFLDNTSNDGSVYVNDEPRFFVSNTPPINARVLDRWYNTTTGVVSDFITNGARAAWVSGGGGGGGDGGGGGGSTLAGGAIIPLTAISPDGATTTFPLTTLDLEVINVGKTTDVFVSLDGVWQDGRTQYAALGGQIIFAEAPSADSQIFMLWFSTAITEQGVPIAGGMDIVPLGAITPDGVTTNFTLTRTGIDPVDVLSSTDVLVSIDGVWQDGRTQYAAFGSQISFTQAPSTDSQIFMLWFTNTSGGT